MNSHTTTTNNNDNNTSTTTTDNNNDNSNNNSNSTCMKLFRCFERKEDRYCWKPSSSSNNPHRAQIYQFELFELIP